MPGCRCPRPALPVLRWLPRYSRAWLPLDLLAGLAVALTAVPQALAYAELAGLPLQVSAGPGAGSGHLRLAPRTAWDRGDPGAPSPCSLAVCWAGRPRADPGQSPISQAGWHVCAKGSGVTRDQPGLSQLPRLCQCPFCPLQYGLYSSFMGCFVYCLLGTAKDVTLGPTAIMSLLVASYAFHEPAYAVLLAFLSGCIQLAMGLLRLGEMLLPCTDVFLGYCCTACSCSLLLSGTLGLSC